MEKIPGLDESYRRMKLARNKRNAEEQRKTRDQNRRRCNKCKKTFDIQKTVLRKYYQQSKKKYRLCIECARYYPNI